MGVEHRTRFVNGLTMHVAEAGSGPLLVLLHGFPEIWYSWRHQLAGLSGAFRVVAPDLRGYGGTDRPSTGYDPETVSNDIARLVTELGRNRTFVAGHDWGGAVAWVLAARYPQLVSRLALLNCPHPAIFQRALFRSPRQLWRSGYMFFFQLPWVPETILRWRHAWLLEMGFRKMFQRPEALTQNDLAVYREAWLKPGALEAGLAYYRSLGRRWLSGPAIERTRLEVKVPTLLLWGEKDRALGSRLTDGTERYVSATFRRRLFPEAGHFVHQEVPEDVNRELEAFFS